MHKEEEFKGHVLVIYIFEKVVKKNKKTLLYNNSLKDNILVFSKYTMLHHEYTHTSYMMGQKPMSHFICVDYLYILIKTP